MAHRPIGAASSIAVTGTAATTGEISVQSNVFRIVAVNQDAYVAIGTEPIATKTSGVALGLSLPERIEPASLTQPEAVA